MGQKRKFANTFEKGVAQVYRTGRAFVGHAGKAMMKHGSKAAANYLVARGTKKLQGWTATSTKTKKKFSRVTSSKSTEVKVNSGSIIMNKKMPGKTKGVWQYEQLDQVIAYSQAGQQGLTQISGVVTTSNLNTATANAGLETSAQKLGDFNPYRANTGSGLYGTGIPANDRFGLKSIDIEIELANGSNRAVLVDLYYVTPRLNTSRHVSDDMQQGLANTGYGVGLMPLPAPGTTAGGAGGRAPYSYPGELPFHQKFVRQNWKLLKKVSLTLQVGVNEVLKQHVVYNKVIEPDILIYDGTDAYLKNTTIHVFCIQRGVVGFDKTTAGTLLCTYSGSTIGFVIKKTYKMCGVYGNAGRLDVNFAEQSIPFNTTAANMHHINEVTEVDDIDRGE